MAGIDLQDAQAGVEMEGKELKVEGLRAQAWDGSLNASLSLELKQGGRFKADAALEGVRIEEALVHGQRPLPLSGTASREGCTWNGPVHDLAVNGSLNVQKAYLGSLPLGKVFADVRWAPPRLEPAVRGLGRAHRRQIGGRREAQRLQGQPGPLPMASTKGALAHGLATASSSSLVPASVSRAAAWLEARLQGKVDASLSLDGPLKAPQAWIDFHPLKGQLTFTDGALALGGPCK